MINKAKSLKDDLLYISQRSENIFQKLSSTSKSIKTDTLLDRTNETKISEKTANLTSKKNKLINTIKDLR